MTRPNFDRDVPAWVPPEVVRIACSILGSHSQDDHVAVVARLLTDPRMRGVWAQFERRNRSTGEYYYPATPQDGGDGEITQGKAMGQLFIFVFSSVRDKRVATTLAPVTETKDRLLGQAATLESVAQDLRESVIAHAHNIPAKDLEQYLEPYLADAAAVKRVAAWRESLAADLRTEDDPLTIKNLKGDPLARGIQIGCASFLKERFGSQLHGIAATLAAVALGLPSVPGAGISRSAF